MRVIFVHGGAGRWRRARKLESYEKFLIQAVLEGYKALKNGSAVDAVREAISVLEDSGIFNAGIGSVLTYTGKIEVDAGIMDGSSLKFGGVAAVRNIRNPIKVAYKLLNYHILLTRGFLDKICSIKKLLQELKPLPHRVQTWRNMLSNENRIPEIYRMFIEMHKLLSKAHETVGAIALDSEGRLAAGASSGGLWLKPEGRIGDSPIPGAGYYASSIAAASASGKGEYIMSLGACLRTCILIEGGLHPQEACERVVKAASNIFGEGTLGIIALDFKGRFGCAFNTQGMARAIYGDNIELRVGFFETMYKPASI